MARTLRPTRPAGSSGPTTVDDLRNKIKVKVHGKPEDLSNYLVLWAEYFAASDTESLTELYKSAPPAIKAQLVKLFPDHEVIKKNSKTGSAAKGSDKDLAEAVAKLATGDDGKKKLKNKAIDELLLKGFDAKAIDEALEALNEKEG